MTKKVKKDLNINNILDVDETNDEKILSIIDENDFVEQNHYKLLLGQDISNKDKLELPELISEIKNLKEQNSQYKNSISNALNLLSQLNTRINAMIERNNLFFDFLRNSSKLRKESFVDIDEN